MKMIKCLVLSGLFLTAASAHAAMDVSAVTTGISDSATAVGTIGAAVTLVVLGIVTYKWVRRAL